MGMDIYGKDPSSQAGRYFRVSLWGWRPLADLCEVIAPDVWGRIEAPHTNDGDGLDKDGAVELAIALETAVASGRIARLLEDDRAAKEALPLEECDLCYGSGQRDYSDPRLSPDLVRGRTGKFKCNGCDGKGKKKSFITMYHIDVARMQEFIAFLKDSGGFEIH